MSIFSQHAIVSSYNGYAYTRISRRLTRHLLKFSVTSVHIDQHITDNKNINTRPIFVDNNLILETVRTKIQNSIGCCNQRESAGIK